MKKEHWQIAFVVVSIILVVNIISQAQDPVDRTQGFWFMKKPSSDPVVTMGTLKFYRNYQSRLIQLLDNPVGSIDMVEIATGNTVTWDQVLYDRIQAEVAALDAIIAGME